MIRTTPSHAQMSDEEPAKDWLLAMLVGLANDIGLEISITVIADGATISGRLVSMQQWLHLNAARLPQGEVAQVMAENFRELAESLVTKTDATDEATEMPSFVHLAGAQLVTGKTLVPNDANLLWRGRLSHISGWSLGAFNEGQGSLG